MTARIPCLVLMLVATVLSAQQPAAPAEVSRLQQMESIYQKGLSARHIPLLGKYLTELQRLAATAADRSAYDAEIARIQQIISSGGVLDLIALQKSQLGQMPVTARIPLPPERKEALIALSPALAQSLSPSAAPDAATAVLGEAQWRIEAISAGTYDVLLHYACPELTEPLPLTVEFAGQKVEKALEIERVTKDARTFRIFRLGSLTLTGDHRGETLRFTAGDKNSEILILKSLLITKPRPPAN
jgi:hypothetical protein